MVTQGLLHHVSLRAPSPLQLAESTFRLGRRFVPDRLCLPPNLYRETPSNLPLGYIRCMKHEEPAGIDGEVLEWVNKTPRDPMVELDPVTVFRRIVAERRASLSASLARARAKDEELANQGLHTGSSTPFSFGRKWPGNSGIAIAIVLVLLALIAALYTLRSGKEKHKAIEVSPADTNDILGVSSNGRRKLVQDSDIKPPESVLTAMVIGAASVKGHTGAILHPTNGIALENQRPEGETDISKTVNTSSLEDAKSQLHGPNGSNIGQDSILLKSENGGIDVTDVPRFGQGVTENDMLALLGVDELEPEKLDAAEPVKLEVAEPAKLEDTEAEDAVTRSQVSPPSNEGAAAAPSFTEQFVSETSSGSESESETTLPSGLVDGEFYGQVVALSEPENFDSIQMLDLNVEDSRVDGNLAENGIPAEKPEQVVEENGIKSLEMSDDTVCSDQNMNTGMVDEEFFGEAEAVSDQVNPPSIQTLDFKGEESHVGGSVAEDKTSSEKPEHVFEESSVKSLEGKDGTVYPDQNDESGTVDGEVYDPAVAVSEQVNPNIVQSLDSHVEESQVDGNLATNTTPLEKSEEVVEEDFIKSLEAKCDSEFPDQNMEGGSSASDFSGDTDWESNYDSDDNNFQGIYLINQDGSVTSLDNVNDRKGAYKKKPAKPYLPDQKLDNPSIKEQDKTPYLLSSADQTLPQGIDTGSEDGHGVSSSVSTGQMNQLDKEEGLIEKLSTGNDLEANLSVLDTATQVSEERSREESEKALQAAMPALAMGVGTAGALFGVAGGLQVVGFAALASLVSHDFLWAQSRESLWQELNGITDRQKLLDFLARRNIMRAGRPEN